MSVRGQENAVFKKVAVSTRKVLFRILASEKLPILLKKMEEEEFFRIVAAKVEKDEILFYLPAAGSAVIQKEQKVSGSFTINNEKYYFNSQIFVLNGLSALKANIDLFQLQRRANARIVLPDSYDCAFTLTQHKDKFYSIDCRLRDLSAGGIRIEIPCDEPHLKVGEVLSGAIRLGKRRPMEFSLEVRFVQKKDQMIQTVGLQFLSFNNAIENRLLLVMMDIQREIYLRYR